MKKGYGEELSKRKLALSTGREALDIWYATNSRIRDEELGDQQMQEFNKLLGQADSALADYSGFLKNLRPAIEAPWCAV